ncbi:uncharacterized protein [Fopius arisanus]|uniref:Uncharacterized protein isoform X2 n=2 Tax=Fopius arisanus TaxID=64838 RepID=A0A9R1TRY1_9HYME|nr:PREDICTED: uncharacterized protein LOC105262948 isoform X2 [Fopius arisanus]XP_011297161.1 PREDICTED: uncharacterized protein LOC105262948 isoform X2 [Fopius arisanus]XP_011297162.1 PREDICTED: uncharacterized protein LOC105262948 isoform X2 [Fopius arisanus]
MNVNQSWMATITFNIRQSALKPLTCCCCISRETGIQILGFLRILMCISSYISFERTTTKMVSAMRIEDDKVNELIINFINYLDVVAIAAIIVIIMISCLLIIGVRQKNPSLMFPWICLDVSALVYFIPLPLTIFAFPGISGGIKFALFLFLLLMLFIECHLFLVVYGYYEDLHFQKSQIQGNVHETYTPADNVNNINEYNGPSVQAWQV